MEQVIVKKASPLIGISLADALIIIGKEEQVASLYFAVVDVFYAMTSDRPYRKT